MSYRFADTTVTVHRSANTVSGRGTLNDPAWSVHGTFRARVRERSGGEILLPSGPMDGMGAEIFCDVSHEGDVREGDLVTDGRRAWRVQVIERRGGPSPRLCLKCSAEQKPPVEVD